MDVNICDCLPRKYGRFMLFIDNNLLLPGATSMLQHLGLTGIKIDKNRFGLAQVSE
jgi:hypothetical protein